MIDITTTTSWSEVWMVLFVTNSACINDNDARMYSQIQALSSSVNTHTAAVLEQSKQFLSEQDGLRTQHEKLASELKAEVIRVMASYKQQTEQQAQQTVEALKAKIAAMEKVSL